MIQSLLARVFVIRENSLLDSENATVKPDSTNPHSVLPQSKTNTATVRSIHLNSVPSEMTPIDHLQMNLHPYTMVRTLVDPRVAASIRMVLTWPPIICRKESHQGDSKHVVVLSVWGICRAVWMWCACVCSGYMWEIAHLRNQKDLWVATHIGMLLYTSRMKSAWSKKRRGQLTMPKTLISRQIGGRDLIIWWDL